MRRTSTVNRPGFSALRVSKARTAVRSISPLTTFTSPALGGGHDERRQMAGEFRLNFYSPELTINACSQDGSNCGSNIVMSDFVLQLALGNRLQPIYFDVDGSGNFLLEIDTIDAPGTGQIAANGQRAGSDAATWDFYNDYYSNPEFRSNVHIGDFSVGEKNFGSARVEGMLIQHLQIQTKDLAQ